MSRMSVAPPIRNPFPPNLSGSCPAVAAMAFTTLRESAEDHGDTPTAPTKSCVRLGVLEVRSSRGTRDARSSHMMRFLRVISAHAICFPLPALLPPAQRTGAPRVQPLGAVERRNAPGAVDGGTLSEPRGAAARPCGDGPLSKP
eukprot:28402-Pleurochrysis_carterae.AAC.3